MSMEPELSGRYDPTDIPKSKERLFYDGLLKHLVDASGPDRKLDVDLAVVLGLVADSDERDSPDAKCKDGSPVPRFTERREDIEAAILRTLPDATCAVQEEPNIDGVIWLPPAFDETNWRWARIPIPGTDPQEYREPESKYEDGEWQLAEEITESVDGVPTMREPPEPAMWGCAYGDPYDHFYWMGHPPANVAIALASPLLRGMDEEAM